MSPCFLFPKGNKWKYTRDAINMRMYFRAHLLLNYNENEKWITLEYSPKKFQNSSKKQTSPPDVGLNLFYISISFFPATETEVFAFRKKQKPFLPLSSNSISHENYDAEVVYASNHVAAALKRRVCTERAARRHKNGRCVPRRLNKSNECRKHDEYASETCMDSARVNGPSPLPRHVRRVYPTGERFLQNSSHVKRVLVERYFFFFPIPRRITPIIPPGLLDWSRIIGKRVDFYTCTLKIYLELSRIKFI